MNNNKAITRRRTNQTKQK